MSDVRFIALVLVVIYLSDCVFWASQSAVGFVWLTDRVARVMYPAAVLGNDRGGFLGVMPLPPLGGCFVARPWPVSATADHVCSYTSHSLHPDERPRQEAVCLAIDAVTKVETDGKKVLLNDRLFFRADTAVMARAVARFVAALRKVPRNKREAHLRAHLDTCLDVNMVRTRVAAYRQATKWTRALANVLFVLLMVVVPSLLWVHWTSLHWITIVAVVFSLHASILVLYVRAHRVLYPDDAEDRWQHLAFMFFAPPAAIRAHDALGRRLLVTFHPLAVAQALGNAGMTGELAGRTWRDLRHPRLPEHPTDDAALVSTEMAWRKWMIDRVAEFCRQHKIDMPSLTRPPSRDPACRSHCPRCHQQYTVSEGVCAQCGGVGLRAFEG